MKQSFKDIFVSDLICLKPFVFHHRKSNSMDGLSVVVETYAIPIL